MRDSIIIASLFVIFLGCSNSRIPQETAPETKTKPDLNKNTDEKASPIPQEHSKEINDLLIKSIEAYGGEKAMKKLMNCKLVSRCFMGITKVVDEAGIDTVIVEDCYSYPDKARRTVFRASDRQEEFLSIINGNDCWTRTRGEKIHERPAPPQITIIPAAVATIYRLKALYDSKENISLETSESDKQNDVIGISIISPSSGKPRSTSYLDRKTFLLKKELIYFYLI